MTLFFSFSMKHYCKVVIVIVLYSNYFNFALTEF